MGESYIKKPERSGSSASLQKERPSPIKSYQTINISKDYTNNSKIATPLKKMNSRIREN